MHLTEPGLNGDELSKTLVPIWFCKPPELPRLYSDPHAEQVMSQGQKTSQEEKILAASV